MKKDNLFLLLFGIVIVLLIVLLIFTLRTSFLLG